MKKFSHFIYHYPLRSLLALSILLLGIILSHWQLKKGMNKLSELNHIASERTEQDALEPTDHLNTISLNGSFLTESVFIQPRSNVHHQSGYQVWVPFETSDKLVLVSLGFQPVISIPSINQIHGTIHYLSSPPFRLKQITYPNSSPYTVAQLDLDLFSTILNKNLAPYIIVLDHVADSNISLPSLDAALKHFNYAAQFFIIAAILCYYVVRKFERT